MRLPPDEETAGAAIAAALDAGVTVFDTARAYEGNEELLGRTLPSTGIRVVTKGGMARPGGAWIADGRARSIRADCEASLAALGGRPIDLYLLHAPDPRTPLRTSARALAKLVDGGLVARVGVCNVSRAQLDEAAAHAPIAAVQVGLSALDDRALRSGVIERCGELGITVIAHSPLGGPRRVGRLSRDETLADIADARDATPAEIALAWVLDVAPGLVAIPGARTPEAARSAARAATLRLSDSERERIRRTPDRRAARAVKGDVVVVMGIPGAGKSSVAAGFVERGYVRLNRDERGGTLPELAGALDDALATGTRELVLDNTYLTRASRSYVVEAAARHGVRTRCLWVDTPLVQAQVNMVERLLDRFGELPAPDELKRAARSQPGLLTPTQQMRTLRELEEPGDDEGFTSIERVPFARAPGTGRAGAFVAASALERVSLEDLDPTTPALVFDWRPDGGSSDLQTLAERLPGTVDVAACPHGGGPPVCWCRPPLPGLPLAFARRHGVDPARSTLYGTSAAQRTLAHAIGATFLSVS